MERSAKSMVCNYILMFTDGITRWGEPASPRAREKAKVELYRFGLTDSTIQFIRDTLFPDSWETFDDLIETAFSSPELSNDDSRTTQDRDIYNAYRSLCAAAVAQERVSKRAVVTFLVLWLPLAVLVTWWLL